MADISLSPIGSPTPSAAAFTAGPPNGHDCETAALLRACLCPVFDGATSWKGLAERLGARGYGLAIRDGHLVVKDRASGRHVCSARDLGTSLRDLAQRLGRPMVLARRDRVAGGELLI